MNFGIQRMYICVKGSPVLCRHWQPCDSSVHCQSVWDLWWTNEVPNQGFLRSTNVFVIHYHPINDPYYIFHSCTTDAMYCWQLTPSNASVQILKCLICVWPTCPVFCRSGAFAKQWRRATVSFKCLPWWNFASPTGWLSWYLVFGMYTEICLRIMILCMLDKNNPASSRRFAIDCNWCVGYIYTKI
jgi:hypothetical protein